MGQEETLSRKREGLCIVETPACRPGPCRFQKSHWQKIRTMVNLPVMSPFKKRYAWVQLAGHTRADGDPAAFEDIRWRLDVWNASAQVANDVL